MHSAVAYYWYLCYDKQSTDCSICTKMGGKYMKTKAGKILRWVTAIAGLLLMGVITFTAVQTVRRYVLVEGELYPRQAQLDLRDSELTERTYEKLQRKLPDSTILWSVPFQGKLLSNDVEEIAVTDLTERDSELLKYFEQLQVLDGRNCSRTSNPVWQAISDI